MKDNYELIISKVNIIFQTTYGEKYYDVIRIVFFEYGDDGIIRFLKTSSDKFLDILKMPSYILNDFFENKSQILTLDIFNGIINDFKDKKKFLSKENKDILLIIERDLKLINLLS